MSWRHQHFEEFVKPTLGRIPDRQDAAIKHHSESYVKELIESTWAPDRLSLLKTIWDEVKRQAGDRPILLPGRDVFLLELLARIENYPTVFRPDISTPVAKLIGKFNLEDFSEHYLIDTGYRGTVPISLKMKHWHLIRYSSAPTVAHPYERHQLLANDKSFIRKNLVASQLEATPKYWNRAEVVTKDKNQIQYDFACFSNTDNLEVVQTVIQEPQFVMAALLTKHVLDFFVPEPKVYANIHPRRRNLSASKKANPVGPRPARTRRSNVVRRRKGEVLRPV